MENTGQIFTRKLRIPPTGANSTADLGSSFCPLLQYQLHNDAVKFTVQHSVALFSTREVSVDAGWQLKPMKPLSGSSPKKNHKRRVHQNSTVAASVCMAE